MIEGGAVTPALPTICQKKNFLVDAISENIFSHKFARSILQSLLDPQGAAGVGLTFTKT